MFSRKSPECGECGERLQSRFWRGAAYIGLGALGLLGVVHHGANQLGDKVNNEGIEPGLDREGQELQDRLSAEIEGMDISEEDIGTLITVGCTLSLQLGSAGERSDQLPDLEELCLDYLPVPEAPVAEPQPMQLPEEVAGQPTTTAP